MALNSRIQTYQTLTNDDEVCIPRLSSILLAVHPLFFSHSLPLNLTNKFDGLNCSVMTWTNLKADRIQNIEMDSVTAAQSLAGSRVSSRRSSIQSLSER